MKKLILTLLFTSPFLLFSQVLSKVQLDSDLDVLKIELAKRHKNLFAKISENDFILKVDAIKSKTDKLDLSQFEIELYKLIKDIGDEHTRIEPPFETVYPIQFDFFKEGIYVTKTDSIHSQILNKRLDGISSLRIKEVLQRFQSVVKTDNQSYFEVFFLDHINNPDFIKGLKIVNSNKATDYLLNNKQVVFSGLLKKDFKKIFHANILREQSGDFYWFKMIEKSKILYFNYQNCFEQTDRPFAEFNRNLLETIDKEKPEKIIIDLRNNSGGNSGILQPFLDALKQSYLNKKGSLFILIGKQTFSSALMNAVDLKRNFNSILIGEETSGSVNHYGETRGFVLPYSKIIVGYSTKYWETWPGYNGGLKPDFKIEYSIKQFTQGNDEALDFVLKY